MSRKFIIMTMIIMMMINVVVNDKKLYNFNNFPWQISLQYYDRLTKQLYHICDGAIVSHINVIVPAYCVDLTLSKNRSKINIDDFKIKVIGFYNQSDVIDSIYSISEINLNPRWNPETFFYNAATISIKNEEFNFNCPDNNNRRPLVQMIYTNLTDKISIESLYNHHAELATWNWQNYQYEVRNVRILSNDDCQQSLESNEYRSFDNETEICTYSWLDSCYFSNGALLQYFHDDGKAYLLGIASWITTDLSNNIIIFTKVT
ncbi:uncharacterized protein LOC113798174 [Dermatophagoides pteronyssinus]|uniref:uncharacterized protein LOC113798174 n=1 Tax=Dermatophagoides pteronyssinus TaxID=6956 RepID=UPI003F6660B1